MLPQTSSIIAQKQERDRLACIRRWAARSAKLAGAAAVITLLASPQTFANAAEGSSRIAQERHACAVVLGSIHRIAAMTHASGASIGAWRNGIKRKWFGLTAAHAPMRD